MTYEGCHAVLTTEYEIGDVALEIFGFALSGVSAAPPSNVPCPSVSWASRMWIRQRLSDLVAHVAVVTPSPIRRMSSEAGEPRAERVPEPPRAMSLARPGGALSSLHTQAAAMSRIQVCAPPQRGWQLSAKESPWWTGPPSAHAPHAPNVPEAMGQRDGRGPLGFPAVRRT